MKTLKLTLTTAAGCTGTKDLTRGSAIVWDREPVDLDHTTLARFDLLRGDEIVDTFEIDGAAWRVLESEGDMDEVLSDVKSGAGDIEMALRAQLDVLQNHYEHEDCNAAWTDTHSCGCDDECPSCGADIEAHESIMISGLTDDQPAKYVEAA